MSFFGKSYNLGIRVFDFQHLQGTATWFNFCLLVGLGICPRLLLCVFKRISLNVWHESIYIIWITSSVEIHFKKIAVWIDTRLFNQLVILSTNKTFGLSPSRITTKIHNFTPLVNLSITSNESLKKLKY